MNKKVKKQIKKTGKMKKIDKLNIRVITTLILSLFLCISTALFGLFGFSNDTKSAEATVTGTNITLDSNNREFDRANVLSLFTAIKGSSSTGYDDLKSSLNATKNAQNINRTVTLGGLQWQVVYASKTKTGEVGATLFLANTITTNSQNAIKAQVFGASNNGVTYNTYEADFYSTSYMRNQLVGSGYIANATQANNGSLTSKAAAPVWSTFSSNYSNFIYTPANFSWQETQNKYALYGGYTLPNDAYGTLSSVNWHARVKTRRSNYINRSRYTDWKNDTLWVPSLTEIGMIYPSAGGSGAGIWNLTTTMRAASANWWTRSGDYDEYRCFVQVSKSGSSADYSISHEGSYAIRPAFHLNLKALWDAVAIPVTQPTFNAPTAGSATLDTAKTTATKVYDTAAVTLPFSSTSNVTFSLTATGTTASSTYLSIASGAVTVAKNTPAGTYYVYMNLPSAGYVWAGTSAAEQRKLTIKVSKANQSTPTITAAAGSNDHVIYGSKLALTGSGIGTLTWSIDTGGTGSATLSPTTGGTTTLTPTKAGTVVVKLSAAGNDNYNANSTTKTITIDKAAITPTIAYGGTITYGTDSGTPTIGGNPGKGTPSYSVTAGADVATVNSSTGVITPKKAGSVTVQVTIPATTNYLGNTATVTVTIEKKELNISWSATKTFTYSKGVQQAITASYSGLVNGDTGTPTVNYSVKGADSWSANKPEVVNAYMAKADAGLGTLDDRYKLVASPELTCDFNIIKAQVAVPTWSGTTDGSAISRPYNGAAQSVTTYTPPTGAGYKACSAELSKTGYVFSATDAGEYSIVFEITDKDNYEWVGDTTNADKELKFSITKITLGLQWSGSDSYIFDPSLNQGKTAVFTGLAGKDIGGYTPVITYTCAAPEYNSTTLPSSRGSYTATVNSAIPTGLTRNYSWEAGVQMTNTFIITAKSVALPKWDATTDPSEGSSAVQKTYTSFDLSVTVYVLPDGARVKSHTGLTVSADGRTFTAVNSGAYEIIFELTDTNDYNWSDNDTTSSERKLEFRISKKSVNVSSWGSVDLTTGFKYNGQAQRPIVTVSTDFTSGPQTLTPVITLSAQDGFALTDGSAINYGNYVISVDISDDDKKNYELVGQVSNDFTINKYALTVTAADWNNAGNYEYVGGETGPVLKTQTITGVNGEKLEIKETAGKIDVGTNYTRTATFLQVDGGTRPATNYSVSFDTVTYNITAKAITILWSLGSYTYNGAEQGPDSSNLAATATPNKLTINGQNGEVLNFTVNGKEIAAGSHVRSVTFDSVSNEKGTAGTANYVINGLTQSYTIEKRDIADVTEAVVNGTFTYDKTRKMPTPVVTDTIGSVPNAISTTDYTLSYGANVNAGNATVVLTAKDDGNYKGTRTINFTIDRAVLTVSFDVENDHKYDYTGAAQYPVASLVGNNYDTLRLQLNFYDGEDYGNHMNADPLRVGKYKVVATLETNNANYDFTQGELRFSIEKITLTIEFSGGGHDYDGLAHYPTLSFGGVAGGDINTITADTLGALVRYYDSEGNEIDITQHPITEAGTYVAKVLIPDTVPYSNYALAGNAVGEDGYSYVIGSQVISGILFNDVNTVYDGTEKKILINTAALANGKLPAGVTEEYYYDPTNPEEPQEDNLQIFSSVIDYGVYVIIVRYTDATGNYSGLDEQRATLTINRRDLTVQWSIGTFDGIYDRLQHTPELELTGVTARDELTVTGKDLIDNHVSYIGNDANRVNVGTYTAALNFPNTGYYNNYNFVPGTDSDNGRQFVFNIEKRKITAVRGIIAQDREFNGNFDVTLEYSDPDKLSFVGLVAGDKLTVVSASGRFTALFASSEPVGVSITGITLGGESLGNYELDYSAGASSATTTAYIKPRKIKVHWTQTNFTYDSVTAFVATAEIENAVAGFEVGLVTENKGEPAINLGTYLAEVTGFDPYNPLSSNYRLPVEGEEWFDLLTENYTVTSRGLLVRVETLELTFKTDENNAPMAQIPVLYYLDIDDGNKKVYLERDVDFTLSVSAKVGSSLTAGASVNAGEYTITFSIGQDYLWSDRPSAPRARTFDFKINKADVEDFNTQDVTTVYSGKNIRYEVEDNLPYGVTAVDFTYFRNGTQITAAEAVNAGTYSVFARFTVDNNHNAVPEKEFTLVVTRQEIDLSQIDLSGEPNAETGEYEFVYNGLSHTLSLAGAAVGVDEVIYLINGSSTAKAIEAGAYVFTARLVANSNYKFVVNGVDVYTADIEAALRVLKAELTVVAEDFSVVYGNAAVAKDYVINGFVLEEDESVLGGELVLNVPGYTIGSGVGTYKVTAEGFTSQNYEISYREGTLTVVKREIEVNWYRTAGGSVGLSFTYEEDGTVKLPHAELTNIVGRDDVKITVVGGQSRPGIGYTAKITQITGEDAGNYTLPVDGVSCTFEITPKPKQGRIVWDNTILYYNGQVQLPKAYYYADEFTTERTELEVVVVGSTRPINARQYSARVVTNLNLQGDYQKTFTIEKRPVYIAVGDMTVNYGVEPDMSAVEWSVREGSLGFLPADDYTVTFTTAAHAGSRTGRYGIYGEFTSNNAANYDVKFVGSWASTDEECGTLGTLTIVKAAFDLSNLSLVGTDVTYDGSLHTLIIQGLPVGVTPVCEYSQGSWILGNEGVKNAGTYTVNVSFSYDTENYYNIAPLTVELTIRKAALTVRANDNTIYYGDMASANGWTATGFVGGEDESVLLGAAHYSFDYEVKGAVGNYRITVDGLSAENYDISYGVGVLTVAPRVITVTWFDRFAGTQGTSFSYKYAEGMEPIAPYAVAGNLFDGDELFITVGGASDKPGVNFTATAIIDNPNYALPDDGTASVTFDVIPDDYVIVWDNGAVEFTEGVAQLPEAFYFVSGSKISLSVALNDGYDGISAGEQKVHVTDDIELLKGEKEFTYTIQPKKITITIEDIEAIFGAVDGITFGSSCNIEGIDYEKLFEFICSADNSSDAGKYVITGKSLNANYAITFIDGTLTVKPADIEWTAEFDGTPDPNGNFTVVYDGKPHTLTIADLENGFLSGIAGVEYNYYSIAEDGTRTKITASGIVNAGKYEIEAVFTADSNHNNIESISANLIIGKADAVTAGFNGVTDGKREIIYDGKEHSLLVSGGSLKGVASVRYEYYSVADGVETLLSGASSVVNAGNYKVKAYFTADVNYNEITAHEEATLVINKAVLTAQAEDYSVEYGTDINDYGVLTYVISGFVNDENEEVISFTPSFTLGAYKNAGVYTNAISLSGEFAADNYDITFVSGTLTVTPRVIEVEWSSEEGGETGTHFVYEADGAVKVPHAAITNAAVGDDVALTVTGGKTEAGYYYNAKVTGITGGDSGNYVLPVNVPFCTFDIVYNPVKPGAVTWNNTVLRYNGQAQKPTAYYSDAIDGKAQELTGVTVDGGSAINVGTYTARITVDGVTYVTEFNIEKRVVYVEIGDGEAVYGETPNMSAISWSYASDNPDEQFVSGEKYNISFGCGAVSGVGKYKISASFNSDNAKNYDVVFTGSWISGDADNGRYGTLTVSKASYDLSGVKFADTDAVYDGKSHSVSVYNIPADVDYVVEYRQGALAYGNAGVTAAGVYTAEITFSSGNPNFNAIEETFTVTLTVRKAQLTLKADDTEIVYGDAPYASGITSEGFAEGESLDDLLGALDYGFNYIRYGAVGKYAITPFGLHSENYEINFAAGTLTVSPRPISVEWYDDDTMTSRSFRYVCDGNVHTPYAVAGNLVNGDRVTLTVTGGTSIAGSNYTATARFTGNSNYVLPEESATKKFDVIPEDYVIFWDNAKLEYTGEAQKPKAFYYVDGELIEVPFGNIEVTSFDDESIKEAINAGRYYANVSITVDGKPDPLIGSTDFEIARKKITVTVNDVTAVFGEVSGAAFGFVVNADEVRSLIKLVYSADDLTAVGSYAITADCSKLGDNYEVIVIDGTLTVIKADYDMSGFTVSGLNVVYNGSLQNIVIGGSPVEYTVNYTKDGVEYGTGGVKNVGSYTATITFVTDGNHNPISYPAVTFVINHAQAKIEGVEFTGSERVTYDGLAHTRTVTKGSSVGVASVDYAYFSVADDGTETEISAGKVVGKGNYKIVATLVLDENYVIADESALVTECGLTIDPAKLVIKANDSVISYGEGAAFGGVSFSGLASGDNSGNINLSGSYTLGTAYVAGDGAGEYEITVTNNGLSADNYEIEVESGKLIVKPVIIEVNWFDKEGGERGNSFNYVYDNGKEFKPYAKAINAVGGDELVLEVGGARGEIGANYVAFVSAILNKDGSKNANYALPADGITVKFTVLGDPRYGKIIWENTTIYYGTEGEDSIPKAFYYDQNGSSYYLPVNVAGSHKAVGTYTASVDVSSAGITLQGSQTTSFDVVPRPVYVVLEDINAVYGKGYDLNTVKWHYLDGSLHFLEGESFTIALSTTAGANPDVGKYPVSGKFNSANGASYDVKFTGSWASGDENNGAFATLTVVKATLDVSSLEIIGSEVTYDGKPHALVLDNLPSGVDYRLSYTCDGWSCNADEVINAGVYTVTVEFIFLNEKDRLNYNTVTNITKTLVINKASLSVTANESSIIYGDVPSANGVVYNGFVNGETQEALGGTLTYTYDYRQYGRVGSYTVTPMGLTSDNYEISFVSGVLTVNRRVVTIEWFNDYTLTNKSLTYSYVNDSTVFTPYALIGNTVNGDVVTATVSGGQARVGMNYTATAAGLSNGNYALPANGLSVSFSVMPASNVVIWDNTTLYFSGEKQAPRAYYFDDDGNTVELEVTVNEDTGVSEVGDSHLARVTATSGLTGDFTKQFAILPREVTVIINDFEITYGDEITHNGWRYPDGIDDSLKFLGNDGDEVNIRANASSSSAAGKYEITGIFENANYVVTFINGSLTIKKAAYDLNGITLDDAVFVYDGSLHTVTVNGELPAGVTAIYSYANDRVNLGADGVKERGTYTVTVTFSGDTDNFDLPFDTLTATITVNPGKIDESKISYADGQTTYNGKEQRHLVSCTALGVTGVAYTYYRVNDDNSRTQLDGDFAIGAGTYYVVASFTVDTNYENIRDRGVWFVIRKATLIIQANDYSFEYNGEALDVTSATAGVSWSISGFVGGESIADITFNAEFRAVGYVAAGTYTNVLAFNDASRNSFSADNYTAEFVSGTLVITPRVISAAWKDGENGTEGVDFVYVYEDGVIRKPYAYVTNAVEGDEVYIVVDGGRVDAGKNYEAKVTSIGGEASANYVLPPELITVNFTITPSPVQQHIVWENTTVYYDGTAQKPLAYYYGDAAMTIVNNLTVTLDGAGINAGKYVAVAQLDDPNYELTGNTTATFTVEKRHVEIAVNDAQIAYDETQSFDTQAIGWSVKDGSFVDGEKYSIVLSCGELSSVGKYKISGSFVCENADNYDVVFTGSYISGNSEYGTGGTLTVVKASYDMSGVQVIDTHAVYDGKYHAVSFVGLPEGVEPVAVYTLGNVTYGTQGGLNAGSYSVSISFRGNPNYNEVNGFETVFVIEKAQLTVTANESTVVYGELPCANGVSYDGFAEGDDERSLSGTVTYTYSYARYGNVGTYTVTPKGLSSNNYAITFVEGALKVVQREISVTWFDEKGGTRSDRISYNYDGTAHVPYAVAGNVVHGDAINLTVDGVQVEAGLGYVATIVSVGNPNYTVPSDGSASVIFDVLPEAYVIVWEVKSFVYDGTEQAPEAYYYTALGEQVELNVEVLEGAHRDAGTYTAKASLKFGNAPVTGEFRHTYTIERREVSVIINDSSSQYGDDIILNGWRYAEGSAEFVNGDIIVLKSTAVKGDGVGEYEVQIDCLTDNVNYTVNAVNGTYRIEKKAIASPKVGNVYFEGEEIFVRPDTPEDERFRVVVNDGGTVVGEYYVVFELTNADNYRWEDSDGYTVIVYYNVVQAANEWVETYEIEGWTIVAGAGSIIVNRQPVSKFGEPQIKFYRDAGCTLEITEEGISTSATMGTYYVKVTVDETPNYGGLEFVHSVEVSGKRATSLHWTDRDLTYNGTYQAPKAYITVDNVRVYLEVDGKNVDAGTYTATARKVGVDGVDYGELFDFYLGEDAEGFEIEYTIKTRALTVSIEDDVSSIYGYPTVDLSRLFWQVTQGVMISGDDIGVIFSCDFGENEYPPVGKYPVTADWTNKNYEVSFIGSWEEFDEHRGKAATYTVRKANITINKSGSEWFDEDGVITRYQNFFITLGAENEDGTYKHISLKGDKSAKVNITYGAPVAYDENVHENMTESAIKQALGEGQTAVPDITEAGKWVVYYRIEEANHEVKYGIWRVLILDADKYIVVTFEKPYTTVYGESLEGKNLIDELVSGGYISVSGAITDLEELKLIANAYAYEDVSAGGEGLVKPSTGANKYSIRLELTEAAKKLAMYANLEFKYSKTNEPNSDTNVDSYVIAKRKIEIEWSNLEFVYDGKSHLPKAKLKGLPEDEEIEFEFKLGEATAITLKSGYVLRITVSLSQGDTAQAGTYSLIATLDDENCEIDVTTQFVTVKITDSPFLDGEINFKLPQWAIIAIACGGATMLLTIIILIAVVRKRKKAIDSSDDDGFYDEA